jgi:hypothetical protein
MFFSDILQIAGLIFAVAAFICLLFGVPILGYYLVRLAFRRNPNIPLSWHDLWGLNRVNLLFFPAFLDEEGKRYRKTALQAAKRMMVGVLLAIAAFYLTENW